MGVNYFIFNGKSSLDFGIYIGGQGTYNAPQRDVTKISIPGRNGDLILDNGRFLNIQVSYPIVVMDEFRDKTDAIRQWLLEPVTYAHLEDTYHPGEYRMAVVTGGINFETSAYNKTGKATITFDCRPERYLHTGEELLFLDAKSPSQITDYDFDYILNPTIFESKPIIRIYHRDVTGLKTVSVGGKGFGIIDNELSQTVDYVDIDCELMECYCGTVNCNSMVSISTFPTLKPGHTQVLYTRNLYEKIRIKGRWWTV